MEQYKNICSPHHHAYAPASPMRRIHSSFPHYFYSTPAAPPSSDSISAFVALCESRLVADQDVDNFVPTPAVSSTFVAPKATSAQPLKPPPRLQYIANIRKSLRYRISGLRRSSQGGGGGGGGSRALPKLNSNVARKDGADDPFAAAAHKVTRDDHAPWCKLPWWRRHRKSRLARDAKVADDRGVKATAVSKSDDGAASKNRKGSWIFRMLRSAMKPKEKEKEKEKDVNVVVVSQSSSIARLARRGLLSSAASALSLMLSSEEEPNHITILTLLSACADFPSSPSSLPLGLSLHARLLKLRPLPSSSSAPDVALSTALVDMYAKNSLPSLARQLFDRIPQKNSFSFNTMLAGHMRNRQVPLALSLFRRMPSPMHDKFSWTAIVDGLVKNGFLLEALQQFQEMQISPASVQPDYVMLVTLVSACAGLGALNQGMWAHRYSMARPHLSASVRLANALVDMYSRCGRADLAHQVFAGVQGSKRTRVTWNSMIVGFAMNGCSAKALQHFAMMKNAGFEPDGISYTGALTACSHAGLVEEGLRFYEIMRRDSKVVPRIEHYGCVVDLLARAGRLEEAMGVVESMMWVMRPNSVVLGSLLAACRVRGDVGLAEKLMAYLVDLEPESESNYVLLSNIYASAGEWDGAGKVRDMMKSLGVKKRPGFSMVEIDGALHEFVAGDRGHMQTASIYDMLNLMCSDMKLQEEVRWDLDGF